MRIPFFFSSTLPLFPFPYFTGPYSYLPGFFFEPHFDDRKGSYLVGWCGPVFFFCLLWTSPLSFWLFFPSVKKLRYGKPSVDALYSAVSTSG